MFRLGRWCAYIVHSPWLLWHEGTLRWAQWRYARQQRRRRQVATGLPVRKTMDHLN
jgi:hypothetical protein